MKTLKLTCALIFVLTTNMFAQMATMDAAANAQLAKISTTNTENIIKTSNILVQAKNTLNTLKDMKDTYDEWSEAVRKVNDVIKSGKEIINISNAVDEMSSDYVGIVKLISNEDDLSLKQKEVYINVFTKILLKAMSSLGTGMDITRSGVFEMNDSERLNFIKKIEAEVEDRHSLMLYAIKKMNSAIAESKKVKTSNYILNNSINTIKD